MNKRLLSVLAFAVVISFAATFLLYRMLESKVSSGAASKTSAMVVASHNLAVGTLVTPSDVQVTEWPGPVPPQAFTNPDDVVGRGVVANIYAGETILADRLAAKGAGAGMAATIPLGMRAVAVRVNEVVGLAGFVVPGMRVDLLISGTPPGGSNREGPLQRTLLQNIEVLSAGQKIDKSADGKPEQVNVVNLLATPEQAEILSLASNETRIQLVLRNPLDTEHTKPPGTALSKLFGVQEPPAPSPQPKHVAARPAAPAPTPAPVAAAPAPPPPPIVVEVIHGSQKAVVQFKNENKDEKEKP
ncbi:MAG: Flp pilus assembly protein CpaB [Acidobacteriia bacterium]|nr:Flp pilus assembly protein CpaB [Terriglobia bacterium]